MFGACWGHVKKLPKNGVKRSIFFGIETITGGEGVEGGLGHVEVLSWGHVGPSWGLLGPRALFWGHVAALLRPKTANPPLKHIVLDRSTVGNQDRSR